MDVFRIVGGNRLTGAVTIGSAKNALLPILAATLLTEETVALEGCARLIDVDNMLKILTRLGCRVQCTDDQIVIDPSEANAWEMPEHLSKQIRSSIFMMGPIISRFRKAIVTYPGGCEIGLRPIDLHLKGLRALGVRLDEKHGMIYCDGANLKSADVMLDFPSVGATENIMMAAVKARGRTVIRNAAREPEIVDLQDFINAMGGKVSGAGSSMIVIDGVEELHGASYRPVPDRIVAGTMLVAAAVTGGELRLNGARERDMDAVLDKIRQCGCEVQADAGGLSVSAPRTLRAVDISTHPYPGFPTDMQAQFLSLACIADGTSIIVENVFENRFGHVPQLRSMGANIVINHRTAVIRGGRLTGARVEARDLRGGAALVLAGLAAEGVTEVLNVDLIDRGYESLEQMLRCVGANIVRA